FSCIVALMRNVPVVVSPRGTLSPYSFHNKNIGFKWFIHHLLGKPLLKRCHIHATSNQEAEAIGEIVKPKSIANIPNFVRLPERSVEADRLLGVFRLIFLSRIEEKKGLDILLNALPVLTFPYKLTIVGDGDITYIETLTALAEKNGTAANIEWAGFRGDDKFKLLAENDLLVLPSYDENFGNVVIESLSEGTAVLLSRFVGLWDYVSDNKLGWACELNAPAFANLINFIQGAPDELNYIRTNAPGKIRADFDESRLVKKYAELYKSIING
ncbi:MAG: glycosyltransferase, partial [Mucilaginibacter sp.]